MNLDLCQHFQIRPTAGGFLIVTPLRYDDQDAIVPMAAGASMTTAMPRCA
ncbi:MAG: hypothetical protein RKP20_16530 [Candidatus Competibacter sp.]|nr:hypothetical protein [Candidatus Competibacter sp.]